MAAPIRRKAIRRLVDEDDPYDDGKGDEKSGQYDSEEEDDLIEKVDTDMLPTMLVYRDGELVHNWVRVDWEAGRDTIEELLARYCFVYFHQPSINISVRHRILPVSGPLLGGNCGLPSDDEDDLLWSDEDK
jgi:hypothetical protein